MQLSLKNIALASSLLAGFALTGTVLLTGISEATDSQRQANKRQALLDNLSQVLPADAYDNDLVADAVELDAGQDLLNSTGPVTVYRAYQISSNAIATTSTLPMSEPVTLAANKVEPKVALNEDKASIDTINPDDRASLINSLDANPDLTENRAKADDVVIDHPTHIEQADNQARNKRPVAAVFKTMATDGYSGDIELLMGVYLNGQISAVRVLEHSETPGLGDQIEQTKSEWIQQFAQRSLTDPGPAQWAVTKDGGEFDVFTGATITPRAVVNAVQRGLTFFAKHQARIFAEAVFDADVINHDAAFKVVPAEQQPLNVKDQQTPFTDQSALMDRVVSDNSTTTRLDQ